jgi:hypothetical protein
VAGAVGLGIGLAGVVLVEAVAVLGEEVVAVVAVGDAGVVVAAVVGVDVGVAGVVAVGVGVVACCSDVTAVPIVVPFPEADDTG